MSGPACKTSLGRVTLPGLERERISIEVSSTPRGWVSTFRRADETIADDLGAAAPWIDRRAPGRLTTRLNEAAPALDRKVIKAALLDYFEVIRTAEDAPGIVSEAVARVIGETVSVKVEMSDPPMYVVDLEVGQSLVFEAREIAGRGASALNERWLSRYPTAPLRATKKDFDEITDYWLSIAERVEPTGAGSQWEPVAEALQTLLAPLPVGTDKDSLLKTGLFLEEQPDKSTVLWVSSNLIESVLKDHGKTIMDRTFPEFLARGGDLVAKSRRFRLGGIRCRAWGFNPSFRPEEVGITSLATLVDGGEDQP